MKTMKYATTIEEQIQKLKDRGLGIEDEEKAKEVLLVSCPEISLP